MNQGIYEITENIPLTGQIYSMTLSGDTSEISRPGQFVNIMLDGFYLRRPISVCDRTDTMIRLVYKIVGRGTRAMSALRPGDKLDLLCGLGNGFDLTKSGNAPLVIGGGVGLPPMYMLAKELVRSGVKPTVLAGFNTAEEVILRRDFEALGVEFRVATADGSAGTRGFVTSVIPSAGDYSYFYACGPEPMLHAVYDACPCSGQLSFEERMGCGFGACMGCSCETKYGAKRICRDGPVLEKEEIIW